MTDKDWRICQVGNVYYIEKWMGWWGFGYQLYFENEKTVRFLSLSAATEWVKLTPVVKPGMLLAQCTM